MEEKKRAPSEKSKKQSEDETERERNRKKQTQWDEQQPLRDRARDRKMMKTIKSERTSKDTSKQIYLI